MAGDLSSAVSAVDWFDTPLPPSVHYLKPFLAP
jgi:hypothetical protein